MALASLLPWWPCYIHDVIPLDKNESYWLLDEELVHVASSFNRDVFSRYPSYDDLLAMLATYADIRQDSVLMTPGSDAAIELIARSFSGTKGVLPVPTFYGYEKILDRAGVQTIPVCYTEERGSFRFPFEETVKALADAKILFLCQPNNPLGSSIPEDQVRELVREAGNRGVMVVLDEAYYEFSGRSMVAAMKENSHLVITRTLSKGFGLSGGRIGYLLAAPEVVSRFKTQLLPWPIANLSVSAARALLGRASAVKARVQKVIEVRDTFAERLRTLPTFVVYPSETNFLLVRTPDADRVVETCTAAGVRVVPGEPMSRFPEARALLKNTIRMAVPSPEDTTIVEAAFRASFTEEPFTNC